MPILVLSFCSGLRRVHQHLVQREGGGSWPSAASRGWASACGKQLHKDAEYHTWSQPMLEASMAKHSKLLYQADSKSRPVEKSHRSSKGPSFKARVLQLLQMLVKWLHFSALYCTASPRLGVQSVNIYLDVESMKVYLSQSSYFC